MSLWRADAPPDRRWPARVRHHDPLVLDLGGLGSDPGAWLALWLVARQVDGLAMVVTSHERGHALHRGERAQLARVILADTGREGVVVVAGPWGGDPGAPWRAHGLVPPETLVPSHELGSTLVRILPGYPPSGLLRMSRPIRWVCAGPLTNLTRLHAVDTRFRWGLMRRIDLVLVDRYTDADPAAEAVLAAVKSVTVVPSELLARPDLRIWPPEEENPAGQLWDTLGISQQPGMARFHGHLRQWALHSADGGVALATLVGVTTALGEGVELAPPPVGRADRARIGGSQRFDRAIVADVDATQLRARIATALTAPDPTGAPDPMRKRRGLPGLVSP